MTIRMAVVAAVVGLVGMGSAFGEAVVTKVVKVDGGYQLERDGKPYFIKGGGGGKEGPRDLLAACGGNSIRTWGVGKDTAGDLAQAQQLGLTVTVGFWLGHKDQGFNWSNAAAVQRQFEEVKAGILKYKDEPAVLCWSLGNEMESAGMDKPELWQAIEDLAKMAHEVDPNHPTMTVIAEMGGQKLAHIKQYCPDIDIVGVNSYGGGATVGERYKKADMGRPYVITEYGPAGTWETGRNSFGAAIELTSTEKAEKYRATYEKSVIGEPGLCVGSYAFTWGFKREATATWYGLFLPDGSKLAGVDALAELWSGKKPEHLCPEISKITVLTGDQVAGGSTLKASVDVKDPQGDKVEIKWALVKEMTNYGVQGTGVKATNDFSDGILENGKEEVEMKLPTGPGVYRVYCYVHNSFKSAAVASVAVKVK